jgi:hypothetical protein
LREMHKLYTHAGIFINPPPPSTSSPILSPSSGIPTSSTGSPSPCAPVATCSGYGLGLMIWHDTRDVKTVRHAGGLPGDSIPSPNSLTLYSQVLAVIGDSCQIMALL